MSTTLDTLRDAERAAWAEFERTPTHELRRAHFLCLLTLLRELDARAAALLELPRPPQTEEEMVVALRGSIAKVARAKGETLQPVKKP